MGASERPVSRESSIMSSASFSGSTEAAGVYVVSPTPVEAAWLTDSSLFEGHLMAGGMAGIVPYEQGCPPVFTGSLCGDVMIGGRSTATQSRLRAVFARVCGGMDAYSARDGAVSVTYRSPHSMEMKSLRARGSIDGPPTYISAAAETLYRMDRAGAGPCRVPGTGAPVNKFGACEVPPVGRLSAGEVADFMRRASRGEVAGIPPAPADMILSFTETTASVRSLTTAVTANYDIATGMLSFYGRSPDAGVMWLRGALVRMNRGATAQ